MTVPPFVNDLYRDLRDRRLLPVVIGLGVAILAVPVLLKSSPEAPPPVAPSAVAAEDAAPPPAVFVGEEGVRNYQKRLSNLHSKNPFEAKFSAPEVSEDVSLSDVSETGSAGDTTVTVDEDGASSSSGGGGSTLPSTSTSSSGAGDSGSSGSSSAGSGSEPKLVFFGFRTDLRMGPKGSVKSYEDLKNLTVLPGSANPVAIYLGVTENGAAAVFQISEDVTATRGEGSCLPGAQNCDYLTLKEGQHRELTYQPDGKSAVTYVLELDKIDIVRIKDPRKTSKRADSKQARRAAGHSGGAVFQVRSK